MSKFTKKVEKKDSIPITDNFTVINSGEKLQKSHKLIATIGALEELQAYLGVIKASFFATEINGLSTSSNKMFIAARLTQIQETLSEVILSISTSKKNNIKHTSTRFSSEKVLELKKHMESLGNKDDKKENYISGKSAAEASLIFASTICRRAERQLCSCTDLSIGIFPEQSCMEYLNILSKFLFVLASQPNLK